MKKKIHFLIIIIIMPIFGLYAQFNAGFSSGSVSIIGLEAGYALIDNLHIGIKFHPSFDATSSAGYTGVYVRKNYNQSELSSFGNISYNIRPYLTATLGVINPPKGGYGTVSYGGVGYTNVSYDNTLGGAIGGGAEILLGNKGKFGTFIEFGLGKMPNSLKSIGAFDPYSSAGNTSSKFTSIFYIQAGMRLYFENN